MSGGVDSSVVAALLVKAGYDVIGISMKLWPKEFCGRQKAKSCCSTKDIADARFVAGQLGIPFYAIDLSKEFKKEVMDYFCKEYTKGRTPNPCIVCNSKIKFGRLFSKAKELKADYIATGHYANIGYDRKTKRFILRQGKDKVKDQSYVLFGLTQQQLKSTLFPLGKYLKSEVREISRSLELRTAEKKESQEICFIWNNDYADFLKKQYGIKPKPGEIVTREGKILGKHPGFMFFTIGQRKGLGLGGNKRPLYVTDIDAKRNRLTVGPKEDLRKNVLLADNLNWIGRPTMTVKAKIRYNHLFADATLVPLRKWNKVKVVFKEPQSAITPGQAVVFYKGDEVIGGGWIR